MSALTREAVDEVMRRHGTSWGDNDFSPTDVRQYAKYLRYAAEFPSASYTDNMVHAAELDLLVDISEEIA